jgi:hypothetical protein
MQGVAFENDSLLAESFVLYPYIVYEDDEMIILGSKIVENYYVYDHQGQLQHVYTIPPSGVSYGIFENETLKVYKVRTRTLYFITIGEAISSQNVELIDIDLDEYRDFYNGDSTVRTNLLKQLIFTTQDNHRLVLERNSMLVMTFYTFSSLFITSALYITYIEAKKQYTLQGKYQSIFGDKLSRGVAIGIIVSMLLMGYIATILLVIPFFIFGLDIMYYQIKHPFDDKKKLSSKDIN